MQCINSKVPQITWKWNAMKNLEYLQFQGQSHTENVNPGFHPFILPLSSFVLSVMLLFRDFCSDMLAARWAMALRVWYTEIPHIVADRCPADRKAW